MIFDVIVVVLLLAILGWTWTAAAYLRLICGQLNTLIYEIQRLKLPADRLKPITFCPSFRGYCGVRVQ
jgi:hypothetical protein